MQRVTSTNAALFVQVHYSAILTEKCSSGYYIVSFKFLESYETHNPVRLSVQTEMGTADTLDVEINPLSWRFQ